MKRKKWYLVRLDLETAKALENIAFLYGMLPSEYLAYVARRERRCFA